jgi:hypothetical protein
MKKFTATSLLLAIGVQGTFHIDATKNNPLTGLPNITHQANDTLVTSAKKYNAQLITSVIPQKRF